MGNKGLLLLLGIAGAAWYISKKGIPAFGAMALPMPGTLEGKTQAAMIDAQRMISMPIETSELLHQYESTHPTSAGIIQQVETHLYQGTATVEDMIAFQGELKAYDAYVKDGGTLSADEFLIIKASQMDQKYAAIIDEGKLIADIAYIRDLGYEPGSDREREAIASRSGSWDVKVAYATLYPDYTPTMTPVQADLYRQYSGDIPEEIQVVADEPISEPIFLPVKSPVVSAPVATVPEPEPVPSVDSWADLYTDAWMAAAGTFNPLTGLFE